jgi:hypothetical protein
MKSIAMVALAGVGNRAHEWTEFSGYAFHLRRRLTVEEQVAVGDAVDLRGTCDATERLEKLRGALPAMAVRMAVEEVKSG